MCEIKIWRFHMLCTTLKKSIRLMVLLMIYLNSIWAGFRTLPAYLNIFFVMFGYHLFYPPISYSCLFRKYSAPHGKKNIFHLISLQIFSDFLLLSSQIFLGFLLHSPQIFSEFPLSRNHVVSNEQNIDG